MGARKYFAPMCGYRIEGDRIVTDGSVRFKVSGTSMGGILNVSPWSTPFQEACKLLGLAQEDISDKPSVVTGRALEPRIFDYARDNYGRYGTYLKPMEHTGPHHTWATDFDDEVFSGRVDGLILGDDGVHILEIKTSSHIDGWIDDEGNPSVPEHYYWQVALYNNFVDGAQKDKAYVVLGLVDAATHANPNVWVPNSNTVMVREMKIDREQVAKTLDSVREWYAAYVAKGITPCYDPSVPGDVEMFEHLCTINSTVEEMGDMLGRYAAVDTRISDIERSNKDLYGERDRLKENIRSYMDIHNLSDLNASGTIPMKATMSESKRRSLDEDAMKADGIDVEKYRVEKIIKTLRTKYTKE